MRLGSPLNTNKKFNLKNGIEKITNPPNVAEKLNFFSGIAAELLNQNNRNFGCHMSKQKQNCCANTIFISQVTENEEQCVTKNLKGNFSAGYDEIPELLVKHCIKHIKTLCIIFTMLLLNPVFFQTG
jgi:hypothetical protein